MKKRWVIMEITEEQLIYEAKNLGFKNPPTRKQMEDMVFYFGNGVESVFNYYDLLSDVVCEVMTRRNKK